MSADNPFEASAEAYGNSPAVDRDASSAEVSARTIELLVQTRPWVRLIGVVTWIMTVLMALGSIVMIGLAAVAGQAEMLIVGPVYFVMAIIYGFLARWLTVYANRINYLSISESVSDPESALEGQKNFWRLAGIITLVVLVLYALIIVLAVAGAAILPMMGR